MSIDSYIFRGSNIGLNGIFKDAQNIPEILYSIQKKFFGSANIVIDTSYLTASYGGDFTRSEPNAFMRIHQQNLYSQDVPLSNPLVNNITGRLNFNSVYLDYNWSNYGYSYYRGPMINDDISRKYISCNYPYIAHYSNLLLTAIRTAVNTGRYSNIDTTYAHPLLQNAISVNYDKSYSINLYSSNIPAPPTQQFQIRPTDGWWNIDTDIGIITFNDLNTNSQNQVSRSNPPRISFYRYEGLFGEANILQGQDL
jgi:hypothetical protein